MTFVNLPSFSDVMSQSTGASAWGKPAFDQFIGAMWWPIGTMAAAIILYWVFSHLLTVINWFKNHFTNNKTAAPTGVDLKRRMIEGFEAGETMLVHDNLSRKVARLEKLYGYEHQKD